MEEITILLVVAVLALAGMKTFVTLERDKSKREAETDLYKTRIWASSQERQEDIRSKADMFGFGGGQDEGSGFDADGIMQLIQSEQGQQLLQNLTNKNKGENK